MAGSVTTSLLKCAGVLMLCTMAAAQPKSRIAMVQHSSSIDIQIGGQPFTTYHYQDDFIYPAVRPYFWPVEASDGTEVTIDQAQHKELRPYQRSIWIGAGDVNGADHWKFNKDPQPRQRHIRFRRIYSDGFEELLTWEDKTGQPMLNETRRVNFRVYQDGVRAIVLSMKLRPVAVDVTFANHLDHGLLSVRPVPSIAGDPQFTAEDGSNNCEQHISWCDEAGTIGGSVYGIAIFDHPSNPRHPPLWHAHRDARLATDMFLAPGLGKQETRQGDLTVKKGTTLVLRYEILIHKGPAGSAHVSAKFAGFAKSH